MKKLLPLLLIVLAIALTACSTSSTGTSMGETENGLPIAAQLAVGTLKLSGTDQTVTAGQAEDLIVYWETYKQLTRSDTAAQAEYDGLIAQIEETLTADQMQAITDMNITQQDVFTSMQGVTFTTSSSTSSMGSASSNSQGSAGMPVGEPPIDGGGTPPDGGMPADMNSAAPASGTDQTQGTQAGSSSGATTGVPSTLIEAVIQSLQQIIAA
jgi:hypothetical protein